MWGKMNVINYIQPIAEIVDKDAAEIGDLYRKSRASLIDSVESARACGQRLIEKKAKMEHGEWLPWLKANAEVLGFEGRSTASRLMKLAANGALAHHLDESTASSISRKLWGHADSSLVQQSLSNEHYTPTKYLDAARTVLGSVDLDPASCTEANAVVKAEKFFSAEDDGLAQNWHGRIWLNPPYGSLVGDFVAKFTEEYEAGRVKAGIILVNAHCTDTAWFKPLWNGVLCFTDHRINFYGDDDRSGSTHGSVFIYFGPEERTFVRAFSQFGAVVAALESCDDNS
jgi:phage N-6-adenine-methyltransferase